MVIKHFFVSCFNFGEVELELAQFFAIHFHFQTMWNVWVFLNISIWSYSLSIYLRLFNLKIRVPERVFYLERQLDNSNFRGQEVQQKKTSLRNSHFYLLFSDNWWSWYLYQLSRIKESGNQKLTSIMWTEVQTLIPTQAHIWNKMKKNILTRDIHLHILVHVFY